MKYYLLLLGIVLVSCTSNSNTDVESEKALVKETLIAMWAAIENGDIDAYANYIHPRNYTQWGETDSLLRVGKHAEVHGIKQWIDDSEGIHTEMKEEVITINGNTAWIVYFWEDEGITDGQAFATRGKSTRIFVKEDDKWLCVHGHYTLL